MVKIIILLPIFIESLFIMEFLIKSLSDVLFSPLHPFVVDTANDNNRILVNDIVDKYASEARADMSEHLESLIKQFKKYVVIFKNVNQMNVANRVVRYVLSSLIRYMDGFRKERLLILVETIDALDLLYAGFYVYGMFVTQIMYRKKIFKLISGKTANEKTSAEFPGCHPSVVRILLKPENMNHAMRGFQFFATLVHEVGDGRLLRCAYHWWYNDFVHQRFVPISNQKIPLSFVRTLFKLSVAERFLPYVVDDTLYLPNIVNPVVYSSRNNMESSLFGMIHFVPSTMDRTRLVQVSEQVRDFMKDLFGWYTNNSKKDIAGRIDFQMVLTYVHLVSSMYLLVARQHPSFSREALIAMCHFFRDFQFGGDPQSQWKSLQPLMKVVARIIHEYQPTRKMNAWTLQEQVFFGQNVNNQTRQAFHQNIEQGTKQFEKHLDTLTRHFEKTDPLFRPILSVYVNLINWMILLVMGNNTLESGLLEYKKGARVNYFENYINLHDPNDTRVRYIAQWMVINRIQISSEKYKEHRNKVVKVVFDEAIQAIQKRQRRGLLRFLF